VDSCPKAEPREQRGLTLYTLASRLQKQKARSNPYMVIFNFIGYFSLMLCDFSPPQCYVTTFLMFRFLRFYLSALPSPPLATFSGLRPSLFSSDRPPCYTIHQVRIVPFQVSTLLQGVSITHFSYSGLILLIHSSPISSDVRAQV
jgi:hypothetical protein